MATRTENQLLPYGIGQLGVGWILAILVLLALVGLGGYAYSRQLIEGEIVTGLRDVGSGGGAPWGLYIAFELYAVGIGFGAMLLLGLIRVMHWTHLQPLSRTLGIMTLTTLVIGYMAVVADLGQPLRAMVNIARYARPMSPFFGTFTVGLITSLVATWVYLYLDSRRDATVLADQPTRWRRWLKFVAAGHRQTQEEDNRHQKVSMGMAVLLIALAAAAASSSGFVFGIQIARPGWFSALQAPAFVVLGAVTGTGVLIIIASVLRKILGEEARLDMRVFTWLNNIMMILTAVYIYFLLVELITVSYSSAQHEVRLTEALFKGQFAWMFWLSGGMFLVSFLLAAGQALTHRYSVGLIVTVAVIVNVAAILKRYLIVVPSLTYGNLLPYPVGSYVPTWVEYAVVVGLIAFGILLYILFMKVFPIMDVHSSISRTADRE